MERLERVIGDRDRSILNLKQKICGLENKIHLSHRSLMEVTREKEGLEERVDELEEEGGELRRERDMLAEDLHALAEEEEGDDIRQLFILRERMRDMEMVSLFHFLLLSSLISGINCVSLV